jgi:hypothetical protein
MTAVAVAVVISLLIRLQVNSRTGVRTPVLVFWRRMEVWKIERLKLTIDRGWWTMDDGRRRVDDGQWPYIFPVAGN